MRYIKDEVNNRSADKKDRQGGPCDKIQKIKNYEI